MNQIIDEQRFAAQVDLEAQLFKEELRKESIDHLLKSFPEQSGLIEELLVTLAYIGAEAFVASNPPILVPAKNPPLVRPR